MATPPTEETNKRSTVIPTKDELPTDEERYRGEHAGFIMDSSSDPTAVGTLPSNNPIAKNLLEKGYSPEAIERLLADMEQAAKNNLLPEEVKSSVPINAEHKEQLYSMIIIQQQGITLEQLRKKRDHEEHTPVYNAIHDTMDQVAETIEEAEHVVDEVISEIKAFFQSIPAWSLRAIRAMRRDVKRLIALEGVNLANLGVQHNPREKVNITFVQERGPDRTPAIAQAQAKAQQQTQGAGMTRSLKK